MVVAFPFLKHNEYKLVKRKKTENMKNFDQSIFDNNGTPQVNGRVTHCLGSRRGRTYVKEVKKVT